MKQLCNILQHESIFFLKFMESKIKEGGQGRKEIVEGY